MPQLPSHPPHTQVNNIIYHRYCFTVIFGYYYRYKTKNEFHYCHPCHQQLFSSPRRSGDAGNDDTQNDDPGNEDTQHDNDSDGDRTGKQCHEVLDNGDRWEEPDMSAMTLYFEAVNRICEGSLLTKHLNI